MEEKNENYDLMKEVLDLEQKERIIDFSSMQDGNKTIITNKGETNKKEEVKSFINYLYQQFQKGGS